MIARALLLSLVLLTGGCAAIPEPQPNVYFRLDPPALADAAALTPVIVVEPFEAQGVYGERALIWARGPVLQQYFRHFWNDSPAVQFQQALVGALRQAGATSVYRPQDRQRPALTVRGRIVHLELQTEGTRRAMLGLEFLLLDGAQQALGRVVFQRERAVDGPEARAYVQAVQALTAEAYRELLPSLLDAAGRAQAVAEQGAAAASDAPERAIVGPVPAIRP